MPAVTRVSYALVLSALLAFLAAPSPAAALSHVNPPAAARHVQHAQSVAASKKRMIKVRQQNGLLPIGNQDDDPGNGGGDGNGNGNGNGNGGAGGGGGRPRVSSTPVSSSASATQQQSQSSQAPASQTPQSESQTPTSSVAPTSSAPPTSSQAPSSISLNLNSATSLTPTSSAPPRSIIFTQSLDAEPTQTDVSEDPAPSNFSKNSIIAIAVIASCVGGAAAIWTLIRKWKLAPSNKFDERMQPIEWAPENDGTAGAGGAAAATREKDAMAGGGVAGAAGMMGEKHRRGDSGGSHGSFHSSDADHRNLGRNVTGNANMFADQNPSGYAPDAHDFTAGPAAYGSNGYGGAGAGGYDAYNTGGYVDLQRSNSGSRGADLQRGPSLGGNAAYGGAHGGANDYDYGAGYGATANGSYPPRTDAAYAQDAYGGYDSSYGQQAAYGGHGQQQYGGAYGARY